MTAATPSSTKANDLFIQTLGRFAVYRGGDPLPESIWSREKARILFQYFVTTRSQLTPKERIVDELWPELDAERSDRDFKVALSALNTALQPDRPSRGMSAYIQRQGFTYGLDPEAPIIIDADEFEEGLAFASRIEARDKAAAIDRYRQALNLYQGEYLPERLYDDWTSAERERLTALYLVGATHLAKLLLAPETVVESIIWSQRVIAIDNCWEEAYRLLMRAYMLSGNRPQALRVYERCRAALERELGVTPMAETLQLYQSFL